MRIVAFAYRMKKGEGDSQFAPGYCGNNESVGPWAPLRIPNIDDLDTGLTWKSGQGWDMLAAMDLGPLLDAHGYLRVERPPELWGAAVDDVIPFGYSRAAGEGGSVTVFLHRRRGGRRQGRRRRR